MSKKIRDTTSRLRARAGWSNVLIGESNVAIDPAIGGYGVADIYLGEFSPHDVVKRRNSNIIRPKSVVLCGRFSSRAPFVSHKLVTKANSSSKEL